MTPMTLQWAAPPSERVSKQIIRCTVEGTYGGDTLDALQSSVTARSSMFHSVVHSDVADQLNRQNEEVQLSPTL